MSEAVGEIGLDLVINQQQYQKQLKGITSMAKKAGAALVAAFSIKMAFDFSKECIKLGSDLQEVQNIVDVTFPHMTAQIDEFAKSAAASFGLSETMAKRFSAMFGTMAKQFGFSEKAAYDMGTTLAGLAGDVASFYDMTQDEAYTKLKAVFSGETEVLKDIGVVMTQNALDAYALANGYGKTTQAMSELEKVSLRYAFVQDQLTAASGDFIRTSDSWANQVRVLKLQFDSLKATIGQGLINLFTPVVKAINAIISKLMVLANAFKAFTELITGKKAASGVQNVAGAATDGFDNAAGAADNLSNATAGTGKAAKKAAKEMKALMGFDEINKISEPDTDDSDTGSGGGSGGSTGGASAGAIDFGDLAEGETVVDKIDKRLQALINRAKELASLFKTGFTIGFGDSAKRIDEIKQHLEGIGISLKNIFTDSAVVSSFNNMLNAFAINAGKIAGSIASVGVTIATNLVGGIDKYLEQNASYIKQRLTGIFNVSADISNLLGDFYVAFADIFSVFGGEDAQQITADIIAVFSNGFLGAVEIAGKLGRDITSAILGPIIDNKDKLKNSLSETISAIRPVFDGLKDQVTNTFSKIIEVYDTYIKPAFDNLRDGISTVMSAILDAYNKFLLPVIQKIGTGFKDLSDNHIQPLIDAFLAFAGKVIEAVSQVWNFISPFVGWLSTQVIQVIAAAVEALWAVIKNVIAIISDAITGLIGMLSGIVDFFTGIFTGNIELAWQGVEEIFQGAVDILKGILGGIISFLSDIWDMIKRIFEPAIEWFKERFSLAYAAITAVFAAIGAWFQERYTDITNVFLGIHTWFQEKFQAAYTFITTVFALIGQWFQERYNDIVNAFSGIAEWFKTLFNTAWTSITGIFKGIGTWFVSRYKDVTNAFKDVAGWFGRNFSEAWKKITKAFSGVGEFFGGLWKIIKSKFTDIGTKIGDAIGGAFKKAMNKVFETVENAINSGISLINGAIGIINTIPGVGISTIGAVQLPRLAQGGYVKANTPQLAMIGDNRHQGEVVAPEDKLQEMVDTAVARASGSGAGNQEMINLLKQLISLVEDGGDIVLMVGDQELARAANKGNLKLKRKFSTAGLIFE